MSQYPAGHVVVAWADARGKATPNTNNNAAKLTNSFLVIWLHVHFSGELKLDVPPKCHVVSGVSCAAIYESCGNSFSNRLLNVTFVSR
jgi:hypothetical protein